MLANLPALRISHQHLPPFFMRSRILTHDFHRRTGAATIRYKPFSIPVERTPEATVWLRKESHYTTLG